jgi:predicted DNA-binding transcriptional regulator YafY
MKEFRNRWYVLGYSEARHFIITLALDRIIKLKEANTAFKENKKLKPKEYFKHTLGITLGKGPVEDIELWFSPTMAPYIKTQHLHHTQKTIHEDKHGLTINLKLIPNPELLQLLLSYCGNVKVLAPVSLKEKYREDISKGMEMCG